MMHTPSRACWFLLAIALGAMPLARATETGEKKKPSVLFLCVDDLRPQLGCCGLEYMVTPQIDRLAASGRLFTRHFVQVPTCGASRYALLSGRKPARAASYGNGAFALMKRGAPGRPISLPHLFRRAGYRTVCLGKVSHSPDGRRFAQSGAGGDGSPEMPLAWDEVGAPAGCWKTSWRAFFGYAGGGTRRPGKTPPLECAQVGDEGYPDGLIAAAAIEALAALKDQRFFLAVGFYKPHLPFNAPKRYWDLYDPARIPPVEHPGPPLGVDPKISLHSSGELLRNYGGHPADPREDAAYARRLRHAYCACVSYVDAQIGKVLAALERLGRDRDTIVVLWGDHGWHLGELHLWGKHTTFEYALRSPLIVRVPGMAAPGVSTAALVESLDIYPTLAELCSLEAPAGLDGASFAPLLRDPHGPGKAGARGYWRRGKLTGKTLRTERWRIVRWKRGGATAQVELYDHRADPGETRNVAAGHPEIVARLLARLEP